MREIKFRQFIGGKFHYWGILGEGNFVAPASTAEETIFSTPHEQYTGLKDHKGMDIYEGDVVIVGSIFAQVEWDDDEAGFHLVEDYQLPMDGGEGLQIIGNIHENPELMEAA